MSKSKFILLIIFYFFIFSSSSQSSSDDLVNKISKNIRCLICQGQTIYDSQSDFSISMRLLIRQKLAEGKSEKEIYGFLKAKYGKWISYEPEINKKTIILWILPILLFFVGGAIIVRKLIVQKL